MTRQRRTLRVFVAAAVAAAVVAAVPVGAGAVTITGFVSLLDAAAGNGWAIHPDQAGAASERFVVGPLTPPAGQGSLELTVPTTTDGALVFTVPNPGTGATPPGDVGPFNPTPWGNTSGSFSTFTANTTSPASSIPVLKLVGYQQFNAANPLLSTGFTTLNFEGSNQPGGVVANQWQTWVLGPTSLVWQSNQTDPFCPIESPCTLAAFAAQYQAGAWGQIQVGLGLGVGPDAVGNVDNVQVSDGTTTFTYDFEPLVAPTTPLAPAPGGGAAAAPVTAAPRFTG